MDIKFNNIKELYIRVLPALKSKVHELKQNNITYIKEADIWNCMIEKYWKTYSGLTLYDIVDDILNSENSMIEEYVKEQMKKQETEIDTNLEII